MASKETVNMLVGMIVESRGQSNRDILLLEEKLQLLKQTLYGRHELTTETLEFWGEGGIDGLIARIACELNRQATLSSAVVLLRTEEQENVSLEQDVANVLSEAGFVESINGGAGFLVSSKTGRLVTVRCQYEGPVPDRQEQIAQEKRYLHALLKYHFKAEIAPNGPVIVYEKEN